MPIGTDRVIHEEPDPESARNDGSALGRVIERAARRFRTPLAVPLMDLRLEKIHLLALAGIPAASAETSHFSSPLDDAQLARLSNQRDGWFCPGSRACNQALANIRSLGELFPVGMSIAVLIGDAAAC